MNGVLVLSVLATREQVSFFIRSVLDLVGAKQYCFSDHNTRAVLPNSYHLEMGRALTSRLVVFEQAAKLGELVALKRRTVELEQKYARGDSRCFNLNPGFLDAHYLYMASHKDSSRRAQLADDVWMEPQLRWSGGKLKDLPWTFAEFKPECRKQLLQQVFFSSATEKVRLKNCGERTDVERHGFRLRCK